MNKKYWLVCNQCGYVKEIFSEQEIYDSEECFLCGGKMNLDLNRGKKLELEPLGDNFPKIPNDFIADKHITFPEHEIINSINMIGDSGTWELIEAIADAKERIKYRMIFFKYNGKIPERKE